jgi:hypothetical protein
MQNSVCQLLLQNVCNINRADGKEVAACMFRDLLNSLLYHSMQQETDMAGVLQLVLSTQNDQQLLRSGGICKLTEEQ